jgi:hypothetical protein
MRAHNLGLRVKRASPSRPKSLAAAPGSAPAPPTTPSPPRFGSRRAGGENGPGERHHANLAESISRQDGQDCRSSNGRPVQHTGSSAEPTNHALVSPGQPGLEGNSFRSRLQAPTRIVDQIVAPGAIWLTGSDDQPPVGLALALTGAASRSSSRPTSRAARRPNGRAVTSLPLSFVCYWRIAQTQASRGGRTREQSRRGPHSPPGHSFKLSPVAFGHGAGAAAAADHEAAGRGFVFRAIVNLAARRSGGSRARARAGTAACRDI